MMTTTTFKNTFKGQKGEENLIFQSVFFSNGDHCHTSNTSFLAVQDSSISDIVGLSEPTNNQSLGSIKEWP